MAKRVKLVLDYDIGDEVYLVTEEDAVKRLVVEIRLLPGGVAMYVVASGDMEPSEHYAIELSATKPVV